METPNVMEGLALACREAALNGIDPPNITYYFRRVMVIPTGKVPGMAVWRKTLFAAMHLRIAQLAERSQRNVDTTRESPSSTVRKFEEPLAVPAGREDGGNEHLLAHALPRPPVVPGVDLPAG